MHEWRGFGPSASSQWSNWRFTNPANMQEWLAGDPSSKIDVIELDNPTLATDALIFGLRMNEGVNLQQIQQRWPDIDLSPYHLLWENLEESGYIKRNGTSIGLTEEGRLRVDAIGSELLGVAMLHDN